jgi:hypothetical protein
MCILRTSACIHIVWWNRPAARESFSSPSSSSLCRLPATDFAADVVIISYWPSLRFDHQQGIPSFLLATIVPLPVSLLPFQYMNIQLVKRELCSVYCTSDHKPPHFRSILPCICGTIWFPLTMIPSIAERRQALAYWDGVERSRSIGDETEAIGWKHVRMWWTNHPLQPFRSTPWLANNRQCREHAVYLSQTIQSSRSGVLTSIFLAIIASCRPIISTSRPTKADVPPKGCHLYGPQPQSCRPIVDHLKMKRPV